MPSILCSAARPAFLFMLLAAVLVSLSALLSPSERTSAVGTVFTVTNADDPGNGVCDSQCTLREAINAANGTTGATIGFNIAGCPPACTIALGSELPWITGAGTLVDGKSEPDFAGVPLVILDGSAINPASFAYGLILQANNVTVRGLELRNFAGGGINADFTEHDNRRVEENVIRDNGYYGVTMTGSNTTVVNNLVDGNAGGIIGHYAGSHTDQVITGNTVTNNLGGGITTVSSNALIAENIVSGNAGTGISNGFGGSQPGVRIMGNQVVGNGEYGIIAGEDGLVVSGNEVSGNGFSGIQIFGSGAEVTGNTVTGNGTSPNPPDLATRPGVLNGLVAAWPGVTLSQDNVVFRGNTVSGNPGDGVVVYSGAGLIIGGTSPSEGNAIFGNGGDGIHLRDDGVVDPAGISILRNSIHSNGGLGIDLDPDGVTANDPDDADTGPNNLQNFPVLIGASTGSLSVEGLLDSLPATTFRLELYANDDCDPSGSGEGQTFITSFTDVTGSGGDLTFSRTVDTQVPAGKFITATATNLSTGDTSEFSNCVEVQGQSTGTATPTPTPEPTPTPTPTGEPTDTPTPTPTPTASPIAQVQGDVNCDGSVTSVDSLGILRYVAGLPPLAQQEPCPDIGTGNDGFFGDVDCKNLVNSVDALGVLRFVAGLSPLAQQEPCTDIGDSPATGT